MTIRIITKPSPEREKSTDFIYATNPIEDNSCYGYGAGLADGAGDSYCGVIYGFNSGKHIQKGGGEGGGSSTGEGTRFGMGFGYYID